MLKRLLFFIFFSFSLNAEEKKLLFILTKAENYKVKKNLLYSSIFAKDLNLDINIINMMNDINLIELIKEKKPDFIITYENFPELKEAVFQLKEKEITVLTFDKENTEKSYFKVSFERKENINYFLKILSSKDKLNISFMLPSTKIGNSYANELANFKKKKSKIAIRDILFYDNESTFLSSLKKIENNYYLHVMRDFKDNVIIQNHREKNKIKEGSFSFEREKIDTLYIVIDKKNKDKNDYILDILSKSNILSKNINIIIDSDKFDNFSLIDSNFYNVFFTGLNFPYLNAFNKKFYDEFNFYPNELSYNLYDLISILTKYNFFEFKKDMFFSGILTEKIKFSLQEKSIKRMNMNFYKYNINDNSFINYDI